MMLSTFDKAINHTVIKIEKGYSNHKHDRGGETYYGISRRFFPSWPGWNLVDQAKQHGKPVDSESLFKKLYPLIKSFYRDNFWCPILGDEIAAISESVAMEVFDTAVNIGVSGAITILQKSLNLLNRNQQSYEDILVDGLIGDETLGAVQTIARYEGYDNLLLLMNYYQAYYYISLAEQRPSQEIMLRGWLNKRVAV